MKRNLHQQPVPSDFILLGVPATIKISMEENKIRFSEQAKIILDITYDQMGLDGFCNRLQNEGCAKLLDLIKQFSKKPFSFTVQVRFQNHKNVDIPLQIFFDEQQWNVQNEITAIISKIKPLKNRFSESGENQIEPTANTHTGLTNGKSAMKDRAMEKQLSELHKISAELDEARKAALNLLEDTIASKEALMKSEGNMQQLNASLEEEVALRSAELKRSRDLLQSIFDTALLSICLFKPVENEEGRVVDYEVVSANNEMTKLLGANKLKGAMLIDTFKHITDENLFAAVEQVRSSGSFSSEFFCHCKTDGKWLNAIFVQVDDHVLMTAVDVTDKKKHEEEIKKSLSILEQSEEMVKMGSWEYKIATGRFILSAGMQQIFGVAANDSVKPDIYLELALPQSVSAAGRVVRNIKSGAESFEEIIELRNADVIKIIRVKGTVIKAKNGKAVKVIGVDIDMTNEKRSEEITRMMTECLFELDNEWKITYINEAALKFFNVEHAEIEHKSFWSAFPGLIGTPIHRQLMDLMSSRKALRKEFFLDRFQRWIYASVSPSSAGLIVLFNDIQAQKNAADKIRENEVRLRTLFENTPDAIARFDTAGRVLFMNKACENYLGRKSEDMEGKTSLEQGESQKIAGPFHHNIEVVTHSGMPIDYLHSYDSAIGFRHFHTRFMPEFDDKGNVQSVLAIARDITELKTAQEELLEKNRRLTETQKILESKDNFIHIASHELKTPITSLQGYAQLLAEAYRDSEEDSFLKKGLTVINRQVVKLTALINDLLDITRIETGAVKLEITSFDLCEMIRETVEFIKPTMRHQVHLYGIDCLEVEGDKEKINQVFTNLLTNAVKYSPGADRVDITVTADEGFVTVAVKDYGIGIPESDLEKIFERFYRVVSNEKESGFSGFGIGLYIAMDIVRKHSGKLWAESELGKGSTFYFSLKKTG